MSTEYATWLNLTQGRADIHDEMRDIMRQGRLTEERRNRYDALSRELDKVSTEIRVLENGNPDFKQRGPRVIEDRSQSHGNVLSFPAGSGSPEYRSNFSHFLRTGERRDLALTTATQSTGTSVLVAQDFGKQIENALLFSGSMLKLAKIYPTETGAPLPLPSSNDTAQEAAIVGEGTAATESDMTLGATVLGAFKYSTGLVTVSIELAQDSNFDLSSWLAEQFGLRLRRKLNRDFTVGVGTTEPYGIITQATAGPTAAGSSSNDGSAADGTNSIGSDDLLALIHSVDPLYRENGVFQANDDTIRQILQVKNKYGNPLFEMPDVGQPASIFGHPIYPNNDMDTIASGKKTVLFGDHSKYVCRQVKDLSVLRLVERYAEKGQIGFIGFARFDGNLLDAGTHPVKYLVQA